MDTEDNIDLNKNQEEKQDNIENPINENVENTENIETKEEINDKTENNEIIKMWTIYVLELENNKCFLHTIEEQEISKEQIFLECKILYSFVKNNPPINISNTITVFNLLDVDLYVKQFMFDCGINNVRGGFYTDEILSPETVEMLNAQLFIKENRIIENQDIMEMIYQKYNTDIINFKVNAEYIIQEKQRLTNELIKYNNIKQNLNNFKNNQNNAITIELLSDLKWIKNIILCSRYQSEDLDKMVAKLPDANDITDYDILCSPELIHEFLNEYKQQNSLSKQERQQKYKQIISKLKSVYLIYVNNFKNVSYSPQFYLSRPDIVLDYFIYHLRTLQLNAQSLDNNIQESIKLLAIFEYMIYKITNRIDEDEHTLSTYPEYYERFIHCSCEFLDNVHQ
jgi:hypothetical protein